MSVDLHTHTIASGHALGTVREMAAAACEQGVTTLGVAEHGPSMEGAPHAGYFWVVEDAPPFLDGVKILLGVEANVLDVTGGLDLSAMVLRKQRVRLLGLHERTPYQGCSLEENTQALVAALTLHPYMHAISHPIRSEFPIDIPAVVEAAAQHNVAFELNGQLFRRAKPDILEQYRGAVLLCRQNGVPIVAFSDAHSPHRVGDIESVRVWAADVGLEMDDLLHGADLETWLEEKDE